MDNVTRLNLLKRIAFVRDILSKKKTVVCNRVENIVGGEMGYKKGRNFPTPAVLKEFATTDRWSGKKDCHYVFYFEIQTPSVEEYERCELRFLTDRDKAYNPQFIIYDNGRPVQGIDNEHKNVIVSSGKKHKVYAYCYGGALIEDTYSFDVYLAVVNEDIEQFLYDLDFPMQWLDITEPKYAAYFDCLRVLQETLNLVDLHTTNSQVFHNSVKEARQYLKENFYANKQLEAVPNGEVTAVGHSHIDVAWLWTLQQTAEKVQHTLSSMLPLFKQYPEYCFLASQPVLYQYLKEEDVELYQQVKDLVKGGQWEAEGGMWLEPDCNIPSGESFVRQLLYGKEYFRKEFGVESEIAWLPDSFGYTASLPQIFAKSGIKTFVTSKLSWSEANIMPNDLFQWRGIDGSEITAYFITTQEYVKGQEILNYTRYSGILTPSQAKGCYDRFRNKEICQKTLMPFGFGDGGGGTNSLDLEAARRMKKVLPEMPKVKLGKARDFFRNLHESIDKNKLPVWVGELYLELHRGIFSTGADIKKCNRTNEFLLQNAELFGTINEYLLKEPYPAKILRENWLTLLTNQFHDLLSGTCIEAVNKKAAEDYKNLYSAVAPLYYDAMQLLAEKIEKKSECDWVVFNPNGFTVDTTINIGKEYRSVQNIPAKGYAVCELLPVLNSVVLGEKTMENECLKLTFDENGDINELYDKRAQRELIKAGRKMGVCAYEDVPFQYDAWEVKRDSYEKELPLRFCSMTPFREGCRAGFEIRKEVEDSIIVQKVVLYENQPLVDFETKVEWKQTGTMLKACFPLDINAEKATNEIPFGYLQRELNDNTSWEQARFEVCMHKYVDISEGNYGVALLNDCKYGYGIFNNEINLTLLKSPTYPDPTCDRGNHYFRYALYAHDACFDVSEVQQQAYLYNNPLYAVERRAIEGGGLPAVFSFVTTDKENVIVDTVKKAENGTGYIIRLYESTNCRVQTTLRFGVKVKKAILCDLQENELASIEMKNSTLSLTIKPFEIVTIKILK